jgi:Predicted signal transduction protein containing sensor and EAL domains
MSWKFHLRRLTSPFLSAALILLLLISFGYPAMLLDAKIQRQNEVRLQVDQLARYFEQSIVNIDAALIEMESIPRNCSVYVLRKFYAYHAGLSLISEFSLFDPKGMLVCSSWQTSFLLGQIPVNRSAQRIVVRGPVSDTFMNQMGLQIGRRGRDGYENDAFLPSQSLRDLMLSLALKPVFLGLIDAQSGVPLVLNGDYSLPVHLSKPLFPLVDRQMLEGLGDNLRDQYWYARPLHSLPQLVLMTSVETAQLYRGIYLPGWQWWLLAIFLLGLLTLFFAFLRQKISDPRRQLLTAIRQRQFFNVYQPIVDARSGTLLGVEVLLRWQHPVAGLINPAEFIPMAESTGVIVLLTSQQLENVARELQPILAQHPQLYISLNIGAQHLGSSMFIRQLLEYKTHLPGLNVEITESEIMEHNNPAIVATLQQLRQQQIAIGIDDFGTGYSSLGYLQSLPVTLLKIDQSFVASIGTSAVNAPVLEAIIQLSQNMDIDIVAEGVETIEQAAWLIRHGVWRHQGWLYAKGEPIDALMAIHWPAAVCRDLPQSKAGVSG